jgi:uncharacterized integral membrane protein
MQIFLGASLAVILALTIFTVQNSMAPPVTLKFLLRDFKILLPYAASGSLGIGILIALSLWIPRALRASFRERNLKKEMDGHDRYQNLGPGPAQGANGVRGSCPAFVSYYTYYGIHGGSGERRQ